MNPTIKMQACHVHYAALISMPDQPYTNPSPSIHLSRQKSPKPNELHLNQQPKQRNRATYKRNPLRRPSPKMQHRELSHRRQPSPPNPMQLRQNAGPIPRRELYRLELPPPIGPQAHAELVRVLVTAEDRRSALEIGGDVVGVRDGEGGRVEGDDGDARDAQYPLVPAAPRVLHDHVPREVLGLLERRRSGGVGGGGCGGFHDGRRRERRGAVEIGGVAGHGLDWGEIREGGDTWRILEAEEEPESLLRR